MPSYQNPTPVEDVNYTNEHPLKEFVQLLLGVGALVLVSIVLINAFAGLIAKQIPFEFEQSMVAGIDLREIIKVEPSPQQEKLQALADRLIPHMNLPEGMEVTIHYSNDDVVNAFATLGGNLVFFKGLLELIESEDELAAVMGHEIAHLKLRHPISALGKGMMLGSLAAFTTGASGSAAGEWLIGSSANLGLMKFSRDQEHAADLEAAAALAKEYGHIKGAQRLFERFNELEAKHGQLLNDSTIVEMFRSHPYSDGRWSAIKASVLEQGWRTEGKLTPLEGFQPEEK